MLGCMTDVYRFQVDLVQIFEKKSAVPEMIGNEAASNSVYAVTTVRYLFLPMT